MSGNGIKILTLIFLVFVRSLAYGQDEPGDAGVQGLFSLGSGARASGMGRAYVAAGDDGGCVFFNPGGLALVPRGQLTGFFVGLPEGSAYSAVGWAFPTQRQGTFAVSGAMMSTRGVEARDARNNLLGSMTYSQSEIVLSYARAGGPFRLLRRPLVPRLSYGVNLKVINQAMGDYSTYGYGADAGVLYQRDPLRAAVAFFDIVPTRLKLRSETERYPTVARFGGSYCWKLSESRLVLIAADGEKTARRSFKAHLGMEFAPVSYARLRAGWDEGSFSFGGGISGLGLVLDYAWCGTDLVGTHRISLTKGLGRSVEEERRRTEERQEAAQQARAEQERQARIAQAMAEAQRLADSNDHIAALGAWHSVINLDPGNAAASQAIRDLTARIETATLAAAQEQRQSAILREHVKMALEHSAQARYREAINEWERVLELDPANEEASQNLQGSRAALEAEITRRRALARASERGEPVQAVLAWRSLLELRPDDSEGKTALERLERRVSEADHLKLGLEYYRAGDLRRAAAEFEIVLRANPNQEVARENLRRCFQKAGSPERPQNKEVWNLHLEGLSCYARGDYRGAIAAWERVLKIEPGNDSALRNIAEARRRLELGGRP